MIRESMVYDEKGGKVSSQVVSIMFPVIEDQPKKNYEMPHHLEDQVAVVFAAFP